MGAELGVKKVVEMADEPCTCRACIAKTRPVDHHYSCGCATCKRIDGYWYPNGVYPYVSRVTYPYTVWTGNISITGGTYSNAHTTN